LKTFIKRSHSISFTRTEHEEKLQFFFYINVVKKKKKKKHFAVGLLDFSNLHSSTTMCKEPWFGVSNKHQRFH